MSARGEETRRCLLAEGAVPVQHEGRQYPRGIEALANGLQLNSIDNMRIDGKFMVGDEIPDGQGSVTQLLEECFDIACELRNDAEDSSEAEATPQSETPNDSVPA
jgi:hypothetical protein